MWKPNKLLPPQLHGQFCHFLLPAQDVTFPLWATAVVISVHCPRGNKLLLVTDFEQAICSTTFLFKVHFFQNNIHFQKLEFASGFILRGHFIFPSVDYKRGLSLMLLMSLMFTTAFSLCLAGTFKLAYFPFFDNPHGFRVFLLSLTVVLDKSNEKYPCHSVNASCHILEGAVQDARAGK